MSNQLSLKNEPPWSEGVALWPPRWNIWKGNTENMPLHRKMATMGRGGEVIHPSVVHPSAPSNSSTPPSLFIGQRRLYTTLYPARLLFSNFFPSPSAILLSSPFIFHFFSSSSSSSSASSSLVAFLVLALLLLLTRHWTGARKWPQRSTLIRNSQSFSVD